MLCGKNKMEELWNVLTCDVELDEQMAYLVVGVDFEEMDTGELRHNRSKQYAEQMSEFWLNPTKAIDLLTD
ncbi:hypothetical protein Pmani_011787 [Petrolisthes manimaculis]|uniref:Uncharacterized protein n=1 Tax=Petrolisthes manimaculis TaxID=1843537 RepID=A0AAE1UFB3_9EUCA|nr:hypothetical protein Pmani_011787 [Petrolisthes manimaculis]